MIDRFVNSPAFAIGFIVLVVYLAFVYFTNRNRAKLARMQGPRRFQPEWRSGRAARRRRRKPARGEGFSPDWSSRRERRRAADQAEPTADDAPASGTSSGEDDSPGGNDRS